MKRVIIISIVLLLWMGWCYGQYKEECISSFAGLEAALKNFKNQYQIANAYYPSRRERNPVCVLSYYHIGDSSDVTKNYPLASDVSDEDGAVTGCLKWKWCINSFYLQLDLSQLQDFSLYILHSGITEVEIELPPVCNINAGNLNEYFLRLTLLLNHYARNKNQLGSDTEIIGYAAMLSNCDTEKPTTNTSKPDLIKTFFDNKTYSMDVFKLYSMDVFKLYSILLFLSLLALPMFTMTIIITAYVDFSTEKDKKSDSSHSEDSSRDLKFMMYSFLVMCVFAIPVMMYFQITALIIKTEWFYLAPYICLWIFSLLNMSFSVYIVHKTDQYLDNDSYKNKKHCFKISYTSLLKGLVLWMFTTTMQLVSWHLVFVFCGFILNPLRALLFFSAIVIAVVFCVVFLAAIFKVIWTFVEIYDCKDECKCCSTYRKNDTAIELEDISIDDDDDDDDDKGGENSKRKRFFLLMDLFRMVPLMMLLIYAFAYCVFLFHINIDDSQQVTIDQLTKLIIPKVFLIIIAWLIYNMILHPKKVWKYWLLPLMYLAPKQMYKRLN